MIVIIIMITIAVRHNENHFTTESLFFLLFDYAATTTYNRAFDGKS